MPAKKTLTALNVKKLTARKGEIQTDYFDQQYPGLALRVSKSGSHGLIPFAFTVSNAG